MDYLQPYEANLIIQNIPYADRNQWEQTRMIVYSVSSMFAKNKLELTDILTLPWDREADTTDTVTDITAKDIERLNIQAANLAKELNNI